VRLVEIQPSENGLTILGGRNAQGKSSVLDAIAYALGGEAFRPSDINNHEAEGNAKIKVEIDGLVVERGGKNGALKITDARGMKGNQTLLNEIVSKFALDLGAFMRANETEKAKLLLKMFPQLEGDLARLKAEADALREHRADLNRDLKRAQAQFDGMPKYEGAPDGEVSLAELEARLREANAEQVRLFGERGEAAKLNNQAVEEEGKAASAMGKASMLKERIEELDAQNEATRERLRGEIDLARRRLEEFEEAAPKKRQELIDAQNAAQDEADQHDDRAYLLRREAKERMASYDGLIEAQTARIEEVQKQITAAAETNELVRRNRARAAKYEDIRRLDAESAHCTGHLDEIAAKRTALLHDAQLPLPELSISEDGKLLYRGQEWDCMSGSERLRVATAICMKAKPGCGFVLIDGLEAMDPQTLEDFDQYLSEQQMQGIGTIVGETSATVIIEDGRVFEPVETE